MWPGDEEGTLGEEEQRVEGGGGWSKLGCLFSRTVVTTLGWLKTTEIRVFSCGSLRR